MKVAGRMARETAVQLFGFGVQLADRVLIAGLLIRAWGVDGFAAWSVVLSAASMVTLFDLGVNLYFPNRLLFLVQQGKHDEARRALHVGDLLMLLASLLGYLVVVIGFGVYAGGHGAVKITPALWAAAALLGGALLIRAATTVQMSVYRAHEQFAWQSVLWTGSDFARLFATAATVLAGGSILTAAAAQFAISALVHGATVFVDSNRRFPNYRYGLAVPTRDELRTAAPVSLGFWIQSAPATALSYVPIFLLNGNGVAVAVAVAQFALMRTLSNVLRTSMQPLAVVFGQESARRVAVGDRSGVRSTYRESVFLIGALGGALAALLIGLGPYIFAIWTGRPELFDLRMLLLAIAPVLLLPSLNMANAYLVTINDPWPIAWARIVQVALTLLVYWLVPLANPGERMFLALAAGELLGPGLWLPIRVARTVPDTGLELQVQTLARLAGTVLLVMAAAWAGASVSAPVLVKLIVGGAAGAVAAAAALLIFGVDARRRAAVLNLVRSRLGG